MVLLKRSIYPFINLRTSTTSICVLNRPLCVYYATLIGQRILTGLWPQDNPTSLPENPSRYTQKWTHVEEKHTVLPISDKQNLKPVKSEIRFKQWSRSLLVAVSLCALPFMWDLHKNRYQYILHSFIHSAVCLTTGPQPLPRQVPHTVRSTASSSNLRHPHLLRGCSLKSRTVSSRFLEVIQWPLTSYSPLSRHFYPPFYHSFNKVF